MTSEQNNNNDVFGMCMDALESSQGSPTLDLMTGEYTSLGWEEFSHHPNLKRLSAVAAAPEDDGANDEQQGQTLARGSGDIPVAIQLREIACTTSDKNAPGDYDQEMENMQATIAHQQAEMERMRAALQSSGICRDAMTKIAAQGQAVAHDTVNVQRASMQVAAQK